VQVGRNYAMVITTNAGLWRYSIGDTVRFTSVSPYRIKISGRTRHFINAFGEQLIIQNPEAAIDKACEATGAVIDNFTAAPIFLDKGKKAGHEWIIQLKSQPSDRTRAQPVLDETWRAIHSDYDAKRQHHSAL